MRSLNSTLLVCPAILTHAGVFHSVNLQNRGLDKVPQRSLNIPREETICFLQEITTGHEHEGLLVGVLRS